MEKYDALIEKTCNGFGIDPDLVRAICFVESEFNTKATRFEKDWRYFLTPRDWADALGIEYEAEIKNQQTSWGLMQVMGAVARELDYASNLENLCEPEIGLHYGVKKLKKLFQSKMCDGQEVNVIASYNAGSPRKRASGMFVNQRYVDKVYDKLKYLRDKKEWVKNGF